MNVHSQTMEKDAKRQRIREAAIRLFAEKGFHNARVDEVAQEAGVAVGTVYRYFKSKEDMLLDIFTAEFEQWKSFYEGLRESGLPIKDQIVKILEQYLALWWQRRELMKVLIRERFEPSESIREKLKSFHRRMIGYIEDILRTALAKGLIRNCDPKVIAHALFGSVESIIACGFLYSDEETEEIYRVAPRELADFIWHGLGKEAAKGGSDG